MHYRLHGGACLYNDCLWYIETKHVLRSFSEVGRYWEPFKILETKQIVLVGIAFNKIDQGVEVLCKMKEL